MLVIVRIGAHITLPGIDSAFISSKARETQTSDNFFGLYDLFVGGAFPKCGYFCFGNNALYLCIDYFAVARAVVPYFQKLQQEGEEGRKKITQLTRYGTVFISAFQAWGVTIKLLHINVQGLPIVPGQLGNCMDNFYCYYFFPVQCL